jgi:hypothetical protein
MGEEILLKVNHLLPLNKEKLIKGLSLIVKPYGGKPSLSGGDHFLPSIKTFALFISEFFCQSD